MASAFKRVPVKEVSMFPSLKKTHTKIDGNPFSVHHTQHTQSVKHRLAVPVLLPQHDRNEEVSRRDKPGSRVRPE